MFADYSELSLLRYSLVNLLGWKPDMHSFLLHRKAGANAEFPQAARQRSILFPFQL